MRAELTGHDVRTVPEMGWAGLKNGELLRPMAGQGFEALLTVDRSLRHQQNLQAAGVAVLVLVSASNRLDDLVPLMPAVHKALGSVKPGDVVEVSA